MPLKQVYLYFFLAILVVCLGFGLKIVGKKNELSSFEELQVNTNSYTIGSPDIGGDYTLINQDGETISNKTYLGKYVLMFFGYTFCPDLCPMTLSTFSEVKRMLGKHAQKLKIVFVSVDPKRDTSATLKSYLRQFEVGIDGLTGSSVQIDHIKKIFRVYSLKSTGKGQDKDNYLVDHTSVSYLIGPKGNFIKFFRYGIEAEVITKTILKFL